MLYIDIVRFFACFQRGRNLDKPSWTGPLRATFFWGGWGGWGGRATEKCIFRCNFDRNALGHPCRKMDPPGPPPPPPPPTPPTPSSATPPHTHPTTPSPDTTPHPHLLHAPTTTTTPHTH